MWQPGQFDRWVRTWGWRVILVLLVVMAIIRFWQMWPHRAR